MPIDTDPFQGDPIDPEEARKEEAAAAEFLETDEAADYFAFLDAAQKAIEQGQKKAMLPTAFLAREINFFQPTDFRHLNQMHETIRAKHGLKISKEGGAGQ